MEKLGRFQIPIENPQKMTKNRLFEIIKLLNLKCVIDGEGNNFKIIIDLPEEHIREKEKLDKIAFLNRGYYTNFDNEKINPLFKQIKRSTNFDCEIEKTDGQYIISVFKK